jgi:hypothetical protein
VALEVNQLLRSSTSAFLDDVKGRVPKTLRFVNFEEIISVITRWSDSPVRRLEVREPDDQNRVSFCLIDSKIVLWAAYPRYDDGAGIVVLPRVFRRLDLSEQESLLDRLLDIAPKCSIKQGGLLQTPMHFLASDRALDGFLKLLEAAAGTALSYSAKS